MRYLLYSLLLCFSLSISKSGISQNLDSLLIALKTAKQDTVKIVILNNLSGLCDPNDILKYTQSTIKLVNEQLKLYKPGTSVYRRLNGYLASSYSNEGFYYTMIGDNQKTLDSHFKSIAIKKANSDTTLSTDYINLGSYYQQRGDYPKAMEYLFEALSCFKKGTQSYNMAGCLANIGTAYYNQGDITHALIYYEKGINMMDKIGHFSGASALLHNISAIYKVMGDTAASITYLEKSLVFCKKANDPNQTAKVLNMLAYNCSLKDSIKAFDLFDQSMKINLQHNFKANLGDNYSCMGSLYLKHKKYKKALEYSNKALKIDEEIDHKPGIATILNCIGRIYIEMGNETEGLKYCEKGLKIAQEINAMLLIRDCAKTLKGVYEKQHNYKDALSMYNLFIQLRDSITNKETRKAATKQQLKYEYEKKAAADSVKVVEEKKVTTARFKQERTQRYALYGGLLLIALFAIFMFNRFRVTQKQKEIIEVKSKETEEQKVIIEEKQKEIVDSINYAKRIQYSLLAHEDLLKQNLSEHFILFKPKDIVSGDFYWATKKNNSFYIAVCDSTGHGVPGAFMSLLNISFLNEAINEKNIEQPHEILNHARQRLLENMDGGNDGMDAILVRFEILKEKTNITYAAANNEPLLVSNGTIKELPKDKMPVGKGERKDSFTLQTVTVQKGDVLYLYTDGFADQFGGPKGKKFKYKTLNDLLLANSHLPAQQQTDILHNAFINWKGNLEQVDDVCIVGIKF